jgi:hypothetical protein
MKVYDSFLFNNELSMLECRLTELDAYPQIYRHVLVEAPVDHQGHAKPLHYAENRERFAPWADRIVHVVAEDPPDTDYAWKRERAQREQVARGLAGAAPDDYVIVADVDEIPSAAAVSAVTGLAGAIATFEMTCCVFAVDWLWPEPMKCSKAAPAGRIGSFERVREGYCEERVIPDAGFHLTWLGGPGAVRAKMAAHCHLECNEGIAAVLGDRVYRDGVNPFWQWSTRPLVPADVDETWPRYVFERRCPASWFRPR